VILLVHLFLQYGISLYSSHFKTGLVPNKLFASMTSVMTGVIFSQKHNDR